MAAGEIKPVLVEIAFAAVEVDEGLVEGVDEVGTGLDGLVVKRYRDLQPIAAPVGVTVTVILREPALLESEPMLEFCPRSSLLQCKLLIEPIFLSQAVSAIVQQCGGLVRAGRLAKKRHRQGRHDDADDLFFEIFEAVGLQARGQLNFLFIRTSEPHSENGRSTA